MPNGEEEECKRLNKKPIPCVATTTNDQGPDDKVHADGNKRENENATQPDKTVKVSQEVSNDEENEIQYATIKGDTDTTAPYDTVDQASQDISHDEDQEIHYAELDKSAFKMKPKDV